ncbi:MAG: galactokinase [Clostridia bacterium]|nr:galactokinase [Clostridia bacterium]
MTALEWNNYIATEAFLEAVRPLYVDEQLLPEQRARYTKTLEEFVALYGDGELEFYSAPGRSEVGGNHTDHQRGRVLACSLNLDVIAVVRKRTDGMIRVKSEGYPEDTVDLKVLEPVPEEEGSSRALIRGVAAALREKGYGIGGFDAYTTSNVLQGSGMSSSAAFEVLLGTILSGLYNDGAISPVEVAKASQVAENRFFGKPSGLLDQMACAVGNLVTIDFADPEDPKVRKVEADFASFGHSLCITDTKGSHADLTTDYAAVPAEMKQVAAYFGKEVLREVDEELFRLELPKVRAAVGDRPVLRAIHWFEETKRAGAEVAALEIGDFDSFLNLVRASGDSSYKYLQNVYSARHPERQEVPVALAVSDLVLGKKGAFRVHGGGFAGTIQAFVPEEKVNHYRRKMDELFGEGSCHILYVRPVGGVKIG